MSPSSWQTRLIKTMQPPLDPVLLTREYRTIWSPEDPTAGFCSIAAEAAYFILGVVKQGWVAMIARDPQGGTHRWLERPSQTGRERFDPTADQYLNHGRTPPYDLGRPGVFMGQRVDPGHPFGFDRRPGLRAKTVLEGMLKTLGHEGSVTEKSIHALRESVGLMITGATPASPPVFPSPRRHRIR